MPILTVKSVLFGRSIDQSSSWAWSMKNRCGRRLIFQQCRPHSWRVCEILLKQNPLFKEFQPCSSLPSSSSCRSLNIHKRLRWRCDHRQNGKACLLLSYAAEELRIHDATPETSRVIYKGNHFITVVPFWASWPFETMILPYKYVLLFRFHLDLSWF